MAGSASIDLLVLALTGSYTCRVPGKVNISSCQSVKIYNDDVKMDPKRSLSTSSDACDRISSATSRISNGRNAFFSGNEFSYSRGLPDTHGLHTLAELCLRRADIELEPQTTKMDFRKEIDSFKYSDGILTDAQRKRNKRFKICESTIGMRDNATRDKDKSFIPTGKGEANQTLVQEKITTDGVGSRLHKLDEELEKMLQGREDIIGREMKEFMENNTLLVKDIARDTSLSTTEVSKFLTEGLHLKEEKRKKLFTWYLEKKLSCPVNPEDESFTCYKCGKIFAYENYLARHVKYVCPDKTGRTWKCSYCNKAFQYPCYLRRHMRSHTGESPYKCSQCSRAFVRSTDLQRHLRNHTGEKPYKCQECSRAFARSTDLKRHFRTHTGEKPYKCWQCSKAFSQSGSLQTHLHTHYKESLQVKGVLPSRVKHN